MKTILIATDFSAASRHASLYGVQLAKAMNATIILFTAYRVTHTVESIDMHLSHYDVMMQNDKKLADEADTICNGERLQIETVCEEGNAEKLILAIAHEKKADLIVMGRKSSNQNLKKLLGSTTTSLIKIADMPLIIVPEKAEFSEPKTILYANDIFLDITIQPIDQIQWMTDLFSSKLHVIRVSKDEHEQLLEEVNVPRKLRAGLKTLQTTFHFPVNTNVSNELDEFIKNTPIDMLVMRPHKHDWIERLFVKSETKDMLFHSHIPLLVLPETKGIKIKVITKEIVENEIVF